MKNFNKYFLAILLAFTAGSLSAKTKQVKIYAFGFAASFKDSIVYFTDIQQIDSAWVTDRNNFLYSRENYSYQLRDYLRTLGMQYPTCTTSYAFKRKKAEKKYASMRKKYTAKGRFDVRDIKETEFKYIPIAPEKEN